ncbi:hypothetical protein [Bacteroides sp.]
MKLIESYVHTGEGYNPFLIRGQWQVAILNYASEEALEAIDKLDVHFKTDEAFVLLKGDAVLIAASITNDNVSFEAIKIKPDVVYNIPRNVWHKIAMKPGSSTLIIENQQTHVSDFKFYPLNEEQIGELRRIVNTAFTSDYIL